MPDQPLTPDRRTLARITDEDFNGNPPADFVELGVTSCFSFLRGASDPVDLVLSAFGMGYDAIGIADRKGKVRKKLPSDIASISLPSRSHALHALRSLNLQQA